MRKLDIAGPVRYLGSLAGGFLVIALSVMLLFEAPGSAPRADAAPVATVATLKRAVEPKPLPLYTASDFDISKSVKVVVTDRPEPRTTPDPSQLVASAPPPQASAGTGQGVSAVVTGDAVNLRAAASKASARVSVVQRGDPVTVLSTERSWSEIVTEDGRTGWIATKFLSN